MTRGQIWWRAIRPQTLPVGLAPVVAATALASALGQWSGWVALLAGAGSIFIQIGTNLVNDYGDALRGTDGPERLGPPRATQQGWLTPRQVATGAVVAFALAAATGVPLVMWGGWPIAAIGVAGVVSGWAYTRGPIPLAYHGLGDLFVMVFFGWIATSATVALHGHGWRGDALLMGTALGAICTAVLVVNNLRDRLGDAKSQKKTLVVRFGAWFGRAEYTFLLALAYGAVLALALWRHPAWGLPGLTLPLAVVLVVRVWTRDGAPLNPLLGQTAALMLAVAGLWALALGWM